MLAVPSVARATLQTDPLALYQDDEGRLRSRRGRRLALRRRRRTISPRVLDAGRAYELVRRDDPDNLTLKGLAVDIATKLHYNPLTSRDAAEWYVRVAAGAYATDPVRGAAARALLAEARCRRRRSRACSRAMPMPTRPPT